MSDLTCPYCHSVLALDTHLELVSVPPPAPVPSDQASIDAMHSWGMNEVREALISMVEQYAYNDAPGRNFDWNPDGTTRMWTADEMQAKLDASTYYTGGMSALEAAFEALGLPDPCTGADLRKLYPVINAAMYQNPSSA